MHKSSIFSALVLCLPVLAGAQQGATLGQWTSYGGDLGHTRYAPLEQIDASNFSDLKLAWMFKTDNFGPNPEYRFQSTPLMVDGVLYIFCKQCGLNTNHGNRQHNDYVKNPSTFKLAQQLLAAKRDLKLDNLLKKLDRYEVIILDDLGYVQQSREEMEVLFTFLATRYERRSV